MQLKLDGYMEQDLKRGMKVDRNISLKELKHMMETCALVCAHCKEDVSGTWTLDRISNQEPHTRINVVFACESCNHMKLNEKMD
jgi:hypothetical protein